MFDFFFLWVWWLWWWICDYDGGLIFYFDCGFGCLVVVVVVVAAVVDGVGCFFWVVGYIILL